MMYLSANADLFIVPNKAALISEYLWGQEKMLERAKKLSPEFNPEKDKMVECWMVSENDLHSENVGDHGFSIEIGGKRFYGTSRIDTCIPSNILAGVKEGDVVELNYDISLRSKDGTFETDDVQLTIYATCRQLEYRYRRFGRFEDVFEAVCA